MLRNKNIRRYLYISIMVTIIGGLLLLSTSILASVVTLLLGMTLTACFLYYTNKRYKDISELSHYLRYLMDGHYGIDVRNNEEGELSILRNELFKITGRLSEQHDYLSEDRARMAEALADISHQLKTPLTSIQMMVDLLEDDKLPLERREQFMNNIQSQLERMDWLVKVLLKLSKLDAGTVQFLKQPIKLEHVVRAALNSVNVALSEKQIAVHVTSESSPTLYADEKWITESILNVIKNASDYTPNGGAITISWTENPILTSLTVHNSGSAIAKQDLPHLFKRFYKGKHAGDTSVGIGLSLSLQIMEAHDGTIEIQSDSMDGTSFIFKWYKKAK